MIDVAVIEDCRFNMRKGMWETNPMHWVWLSPAKITWIVVAFAAPTMLERGVS